MENNNKKYFLKETGEELEFGDIIEMECMKELEDGRATIEKEIKFVPETLEALIQLGLVEEKEGLIDFSDDGEEDDEPDEDSMNYVLEDLDDHENRICVLEKKFEKLEKIIKSLSKTNESSKKK